VSDQPAEATGQQGGGQERFAFRCTFCRKTIGRPLGKADLGVAEDEEIQAGKLYRYERCYCGKGKFVSAEFADLTPAEIEARLSQTIQH
jgi:hypothetical protein